MPFLKPVLLIIFNRPSLVQQVANRIASISPSRVYIASDGPRTNKSDEDKLVQTARATAMQAFAGSCRIETLFQKNNLGCKKAVQTAIDWFFENESEGIILEDDCLPEESFFNYCDCLLDRYRDDMRVGMVSGDNFQFGRLTLDSSYYFSLYAHVWGWASWRRVWQCYRSDKVFWEEMKTNRILHHIFSSRRLRFYWENIFRKVYNDQIDTWDYQLNLSLWSQNMLSIIPAHNLVSNVGFDKNATHTKIESVFSGIESTKMQFPLVHPKYVNRNINADRYFEGLYLNQKYRIINKLKSFIPKYSN